MKLSTLHGAAALLVGALLAFGDAPARSAPGAASASEPKRLVILSTTDMKGKTSPCGCHTPKGGLSRWASYIDSTRAAESHVLVVVNGGYFPELDDHEDVARFYMDALRLKDTDAVGMSEKELRYGRAFLVANLQRSKLPATCANLFDKATKKALLAPYLLKKVNGMTVGVFAVMAQSVDLGISRDSLYLEDPAVAATRTVAALRKAGATAVVLLSELGKVETEDLVSGMDGIDAVVVGRNVPMVQTGRRLKNAVLIYGGEQGQYIGRTTLELDPKFHVTGGTGEVYMLGPDVGDSPQVFAMVKDFEDKFNEKERKTAKEKEVSIQETTNPSADHFVGAEVCARCHTAEFDQWKTTRHSNAWKPLVDAKKDATPDCIPCHVVGYNEAGGYKTNADVTKLANVQCENCHGMGTKHEAMAAAATTVQESTCKGCHNETTSPTFNFATYRPHILHNGPTNLPPLPPSPAHAKMMQGAH